jgi:hypothetical protein
MASQASSQGVVTRTPGHKGKTVHFAKTATVLEPECGSPPRAVGVEGCVNFAMDPSTGRIAIPRASVTHKDKRLYKPLQVPRPKAVPTVLPASPPLHLPGELLAGAVRVPLALVLGASSTEFKSLAKDFPMTPFSDVRHSSIIEVQAWDKAAAQRACKLLLTPAGDTQHFPDRKTVVIKIDTETKPNATRGRPNPTCLLQLANHSLAVLFRLGPLVQVHACLLSLFNNPAVMIVGQNAREDLQEIWWSPIIPARLTELTDFMPTTGCRCQGTLGHAAAVLGQLVSKVEQRSNWAAKTCRPAQLDYAALDAFIVIARQVFVVASSSRLTSASRLVHRTSPNSMERFDNR